jgi:outer membrane protein assembly factor BamB
LVVQAGKSQTGYLLDLAHLGGIGGQLAQTGNVCNDDVDGGHAVSGSIVYLPCVTGVVALRVTATSLTELWATPSGAGGPPIVADGLVWSISRSGELVSMDPNTGAAVQQLALGAEANHFPTPAVGDGLLLAPSAYEVHAFAGTPTTTTTSPSTTTPPASSSPHRRAAPSGNGGGLGAGATAGLAAGGSVVVLGAAGLVYRRRRGRRTGP